MESAKDLNVIELTDKRREELIAWLSDSDVQFEQIEPITGDASFRRYFRVYTPTGTLIVMDAPPPQENCRPFVAVSEMLRDADLLAPEIFAEDIARGFLLISDFGDYTLLNVFGQLQNKGADMLYQSALQSLATLQACRVAPGWNIPVFGREWLEREWAWHQEWFLQKWLGLTDQALPAELNHCYELLIQSAITQPQVCMHRDFHAGNLMLLPNDRIGILDFQDVFIGPLTYDVASLLRDCYIDWPVEKVDEWALYYFNLLVQKNVLALADLQRYKKWFDWMGIQRHLKALLTFSRKHVRDHQSDYLQFVPRTLHYLIAVSQQYDEMQPLHQFLADVVQPRVINVMSQATY